MVKKVKTYNPKLKKLCVYAGYDEAGTAIHTRIKNYAKNKGKTLTQLVFDALKATYPDLGL